MFCPMVKFLCSIFKQRVWGNQEIGRPLQRMKVAPNKVVSLTYTLTLSSGEVADQAGSDRPFMFIHGIGQTLEAFDANLDGLAVGERFSFELTAEQGYGVRYDENVVAIPREVFAGPNVPEDLIQVGNTVPMQDNQGNYMEGIIQSFDEEKVMMDFNHPLAGEALRFSGEILEIRDATDEELDHGHVHGPGGHQH